MVNRNIKRKGEVMRLEDFDSKIKNKLIELVNGIYTEQDLIDELQDILEEYNKKKEGK